MDGIPILDYTPAGLLGLTIVLLLIGKLAPWPVIKDKNERIKYLESALATSLEANTLKDQALIAEQTAHGETRKQLTEEQKTGEVVRKFFDGLGQAIP